MHNNFTFYSWTLHIGPLRFLIQAVTFPSVTANGGGFTLTLYLILIEVQTLIQRNQKLNILTPNVTKV